MVVLAAIGRFFKKIWDWIKQTAWIQPLLIVGIIFGVIFSIPSIVKAAQTSKEEAAKAEKYYHNFQISLEYNKNETSPADEFTTALEKVMDGSETTAEEEFKSKYKNLGDKFFVMYVEQTCPKCADAKDGFALFQKSLNNDPAFMSKNESDKFHMVTIFADEETSYTTDKETAFVQYLERHQSFFQTVGGYAYNTEYYLNGNLSDDDLRALETADPNDFLTPTIFLVELGDRATVAPGVSEIMFGVSGDDQNSRAKTLLDCWNHTGEFSVDDDLNDQLQD